MRRSPRRRAKCVLEHALMKRVGTYTLLRPHEHDGRVPLAMISKLEQRIKQTKGFESAAQEAMLSLVVAASEVREQLEDVCRSYGLGSSQYNVLRILRGAPEAGYPRCDIIERMLDSSPDVTRLIDSLSAMDLVRRERCTEDRRRTMHWITDKGRALLDEMQEDIAGVQLRFAERFEPEELMELTALCEKIFASDVGAPGTTTAGESTDGEPVGTV